MERYGEWEYSLPGNFQSHLSKAAGQSGIVTIVGTMRTSNSERSVPIGYFDQRALELSRITLVEGRLPEKSGEIAVEMETLIRMGLPYESGTELEVKDIRNPLRYLLITS